jgi:hypothetical protein
VWDETVDGRRLTLDMTGINNQNFVLRDRQTGSWWQQATGEAFLGPLRGRRLRLVFADEIAFSIWRREHPEGRVLRPAADPTWRTWSTGWEEKTARFPLAAGASGAAGRERLAPRAVVLGLDRGAAARAWPVELLRRQAAVMDDLGGLGVVILVGEDGRSLRVFESTVDGRPVPFFAKLGGGPGAPAGPGSTAGSVGPGTGGTGDTGSPGPATGSPGPATGGTGGNAGSPGAATAAAAAPRRWIDGASGSEWDFQGRAVAGPWRGRQLRPLPATQDYWFDWRRYHPRTTLYTGGVAGGGAG